MSGAALAQNTSQPAPQATQQPATTTSNTQTQTYQAAQRPSSGQIIRSAAQPVQGTAAGRVPRANASQDAGLSAPVGTTISGTQEVYEQTSVEQIPANDPQTGQPIVNTGTTQQYLNTESTTVQSTQPVNTGQVPKAYTNTSTQLPFSQYQPKPTGRISPEGVTPNSGTRKRVR